MKTPDVSMLKNTQRPFHTHRDFLPNPFLQLPHSPIINECTLYWSTGK